MTISPFDPGLSMRRTLPRFSTVVLACVVSTHAVSAQEIVAPSGQAVTLYDVILEAETDTARFRFLAPAIGPLDGGRTFEEVQSDFQWLCDMAALPALAANEWHVDHIVISMSDREVEFGSTDSTVIQYFEGFRQTDGACVWEVF